MANTSALANLYESIITRITDTVPEVKYINQDFSQLEAARPPVSWPCVLLDFDDFVFTESGNEPKLIADGFVVLRLGLKQYSGQSSIKPQAVREEAMSYYDLESKLIGALHTWAPDKFGKLLLRKTQTEKRDDEYRVRVLIFAINYEESVAVEYKQLRHSIRATPPPAINVSKP